MEREAATGACARRDRPGQQRIDRNAVGERVKEGREYGQAKRGHERELEGPRAARNVHEQRRQMPEEQDSLARAGLALTRKTRGKRERNVSAPGLRGTDEELEQDLEAIRPWLQPATRLRRQQKNPVSGSLVRRASGKMACASQVHRRLARLRTVPSRPDRLPPFT